MSVILVAPAILPRYKLFELIVRTCERCLSKDGKSCSDELPHCLAQLIGDLARQRAVFLNTPQIDDRVVAGVLYNSNTFGVVHAGFTKALILAHETSQFRIGNR